MQFIPTSKVAVRCRQSCRSAPFKWQCSSGSQHGGKQHGHGSASRAQAGDTAAAATTVEQLEHRLQLLEARLDPEQVFPSPSAPGPPRAAGGASGPARPATPALAASSDAAAVQQLLCARIADMEARLDFVERDLLRVAVMRGSARGSPDKPARHRGSTNHGTQDTGTSSDTPDTAAVVGVHAHHWEEDVGYDSSRAKSLLILLLLNAGVFVAFGTTMLAAGAKFG